MESSTRAAPRTETAPQLGDRDNVVAMSNDDTPMTEEIRRELAAEKELAQSLAEGKSRLAPRCPECGSIGTLEEVGGVTRCIDCDEVVAATTRLAGFGRR